ncbi:MAG: MBL fold metallo-hydrolase [Candidatus Marinimicrobia bacterium]|nr:MBL fold metallo-hydrolase [Candidatus Neomarinimicrobiota bacterium]
MIIESIVTGSFMENAWILGDEESKHAIIFDPGDNVSNIIGKMNELNLTPVFILNTHAHPDHLGAAAELQKRFDLPFAIHEDELPTFNSAKDTAQFLGLLNFQLPELTTFLSDGQVLEINNIHLQVLHTPGHTPGSICFLTGKHLFAGDTLFQGSVGRTDLPGGSMKQLGNSLKRLSRLPEDTRVYPGHGEVTSIKKEIETNPYIKEVL